MSRLQRRDNGPEMAVRRLLFAGGARYRVSFRIPGQRRRTIDIAFIGPRLAVYIDGCFWHACPDCGHQPTANSAWWAEKLAANVARDRRTDAVLTGLGWRVLRFWEHEDPDDVVQAICRALQR